MRRLILLAIGVLSLASSARATCTGSGQVWSCTSGSTTAQIQATINSSTDGAVITFAAGSYTLTETDFSTAHGATLICATPPLTVGAAMVNPCTINATGIVFGMSVSSTANTFFYRVSGFTFTQTGGGTSIWWCSAGGCSGSFSQVRFDHNTINNSATGGNGMIVIGDTGSTFTVSGVVDHNIFHSTAIDIAVFVVSAMWTSTNNPPLGQLNNIFIEDNNISYATGTDATAQVCIDGWGRNFAIVFRHNTTLNCRVVTHAVAQAGGPANLEIYNNSISMDSTAGPEAGCFRCVHHQGSNTFMAFNNTLTAAATKDTDPMSLLHYRSDGVQPSGGEGFPSTPPPACDGTVSNTTWPGTTITFSDGNRSPSSTWFGYPCFHQPGRDLSGAYKPIYVWNNFWSDTLAQVPLTFDDPWSNIPPPCTAGVGGNCDYTTIQIKANREYFNAVSASAQTSPTSPFNGTTGMGFGTLANRPTTCTTSTEAGAGVGYFATDTGAQGTLYTCSATNTWSLYYTPFAYPHPLVTGVPPPLGMSGTGTISGAGVIHN